MKLEDFFKDTYKILMADTLLSKMSIPMIGVRPRIICNDGFSMSVQGSQHSYCDPRTTTDWYQSLEIGFPSDLEELILSYAEDTDDPTGTVYGYVPVEIIQRVIDNHLGINVLETYKDEPFVILTKPYKRNNLLDDLGI